MRERIEFRGDKPLDAVIAGADYIAYLVANQALAERRDIENKVPAHEKQQGNIICERSNQVMMPKERLTDEKLSI